MVLALPCRLKPSSRSGRLVPGRPGAVRMVRSGLAEGERVGLGARVEEGGLEGAVSDGAGLADELVHPLVREGAVDVGPVRLAGWLPVEQDAEPHRGCWCCWSHDQVEVAGVEAAGDLPVRRVERDGLLLHGPVPRQGPLVEPQPCRDGIDVRLAGHWAAGGGEVLGALIAGVIFW